MASSSPADSQPGSSKRPELYWNRLPSIKVLKPPTGNYSPRVDERCFTYCSQSIRGRLSSDEPWCRTICLRRVFNHEVRRTLATSKYNPETQSFELAMEETDPKIPLPPEGQPKPHATESEDVDNDGGKIEWKSIAGKDHPGQPIFWKEGWYLWTSKSRWAAQEKMDLMMLDLEKQAEWQKYKEHVNEDWAAFERQRQHQHQQSPGGDGTAGAPPADSPGGGQQHRDHSAQPPRPTSHEPRITPSGHIPSGVTDAAGEHHIEESPVPPFPDSASQSLLVHLPPSFAAPLNEQVTNLFAPTKKLFSIAQESVSSGAQTQFAARLWEKAQSDAPLVLVKAAWGKVWKNITSSEDEDGSSNSSPP